MAVTQVLPYSAQATFEPTGHKAYTVIYHVFTDSRADGPHIVLSATGLPKLGDTYSYGNDSNIYAACNSVGPCTPADIQATLKKWEVPVTYSTRPAEGNNPANQGVEDPVAWDWQASGSFAQYVTAVLKDRVGNPVVNKADEPFLPAPEKDDPRMTLVLKKNTATISLTQWAQFRGKVNADAIWALPARRVKLVQWSWDVRYVGGRAYVENTWECSINWDGWDFKPLNAGFREKIGINADGTTKYREIVDARGQRIRQPQPLDVNGVALLAGQNPIFFDGVGANPDPFEIDDEATFADLFPPVFSFPIIS